MLILSAALHFAGVVLNHFSPSDFQDRSGQWQPEGAPLYMSKVLNVAGLRQTNHADGMCKLLENHQVGACMSSSQPELKQLNHMPHSTATFIADIHVIMCLHVRTSYFTSFLERLSKQRLLSRNVVLWVCCNSQAHLPTIKLMIKPFERRLPIYTVEMPYNLGGFGRFLVAHMIHKNILCRLYYYDR